MTEAAHLFVPLAESVGLARRFVASTLVDKRSTQAEPAVLLTSELVTNAVVHAGPHLAGSEIEVCIRLSDERIRVEVSDNHAGSPVVGDGATDKPGGRGLLLVDSLASAWGVTLKPATGKVVWFEVPAERLDSRWP